MKNMKNRMLMVLLSLALLLGGCGGENEYQTGAMTEGAALTLIWEGQELVLDAVTLATLVTTELAYATDNGDGTRAEDVSVVFDLNKYLEGEGWDLSRCRTWVLTDRAGNSVFVPRDQAVNLYVGITSGADNLDYPVSVIPEGSTLWKVWELARVEFRVEQAQILAEQAERAAAEGRLQELRDAVAGARHIALAQGVVGSGRIGLAELIRDYLAQPPEGPVRALTYDGDWVELEAEQVLTAFYDQGRTLIDGQLIRGLTYDQQALWLAGAVTLPELFGQCGMIGAEDYTCFSQDGSTLKLTAAEVEAALIEEDEDGRLRLLSQAGTLPGLISFTAGQPIIEEDQP